MSGLLRHRTLWQPHHLAINPLPSVLLSLRYRHCLNPNLIEIYLASSSSSSSSSSSASSSSSTSSSSLDGDHDVVLEDILHRNMLMKAAPDWLPFISGSSFWVPPTRRPNSSLIKAFKSNRNRLTREERSCRTISRGWPCSSLLLADTANSKLNSSSTVPQFKKLQVPLEWDASTDSDLDSDSDSDSYSWVR